MSKMATGRYAEYFNDAETSDVKVVIMVAQNDENLARRQLELQGNVCVNAGEGELCAHSVILRGNSPAWKAELERSQRTRKRKRVTLIVEEGEQAAAYRLLQLLQCVYTDYLPDIETHLDLSDTLGILMLADQYQVEAALSMCAQKLEKLKDLGAITWELADRVMHLPARYLEKPGLSCLLVKIQEKILRHAALETSLPGIGIDLELVMRNPTLTESFMALPVLKCASLLRDDRCRLASENTVAAAVVQRISHEPPTTPAYDWEGDQLPDFYAQVMAHAIRVPHLSPLFALAMPTFASELTTVLRPEIFSIGRELARLPADVWDSVVNTQHLPRSWLSECRPPSTITALEFDWEVLTAEFAERFDRGMHPGTSWLLASSPLHFFAGMEWGVDLWANYAPSKGGWTLGVRTYSYYPLSTTGPLYGSRISIDILAADKKSSASKQALWTSTAGQCMGLRGWPDMLGLPMQKWDHSYMEHWTSPEGFLTVRVKVSDVM